MAYAKTVSEFLEKNHNRTEELEKLRNIILEFPFEESIKWGMPSYGIEGKNLVGIGSFKNWSCLWFHQGSFLNDKAKKLVNAQEGKTSGMRQWRFTNIEEIDKKLVKQYLDETIQNHKNGKTITVAKKKKSEVPIPDILNAALQANPSLESNFETFSISQKNEFANYINEAKKESTKLQRLEKVKELVIEKKKLSSLWGG